MAHVKLLKDKGNRRKGEILQMDSASAASLVKRKFAEHVDPAAAHLTQVPGRRRAAVVSS
jgi:hypothetical protein